MPTILPLSVLAIATVLTGYTAHAVASAAPATFTPEMLKILPPPGLYRLQVGQGVSRNLDKSAKSSIDDDGAAGTQTTISESGENRMVSTHKVGPITTCLRLDGQVSLPSVLASAGNICKNLSVKLDGNTVTVVDQCPLNRITQTYRKLSDTTWEHGFDTAVPVPLPGDAWGVPKLLEGAGMLTPHEARQVQRVKDERDAQAEQSLAQVRAALKRDLQAARTAKERASVLKRIEVMAGIEARKPAVHHFQTQRWELISRNCGTVQPGPAVPALKR